MGKNKIVFGDEVLIDLTSDTVDSEHLLIGYKAHNKAGDEIIGECDFDSNTTDATATASEILIGKTAYVAGNKLEGEMPNRGAIEGYITNKDELYSIQNGYHDGSGTVGIDETEKEKLIPGNIKTGITILGIEGTYGGDEIKVQQKEAIPFTTSQIIIPDEGFDYLSQVEIAAITKTETPNSAGGITVTIGDIAPQRRR